MVHLDAGWRTISADQIMRDGIDIAGDTYVANLLSGVGTMSVVRY